MPLNKETKPNNIEILVTPVGSYLSIYLDLLISEYLSFFKYLSIYLGLSLTIGRFSIISKTLCLIPLQKGSQSRLDSQNF